MSYIVKLSTRNGFMLLYIIFNSGERTFEEMGVGFWINAALNGTSCRAGFGYEEQIEKRTGSNWLPQIGYAFSGIIGLSNVYRL